LTNTPDSTHPAFADLGLPGRLLAAVARLGFSEPTPIQAAAIPALLDGEDVVGVAQTGTGKTAAFGLPMLARIEPGERHPQGLVLAPTRELAMQVAAALEDFATELAGVNVVTVYGGSSYHPQIRALEAGAQIVVGTPGRVIDLMERGTLDLGGVGFVVLDEGDEMLRMGFAEDVDRILERVPAEHQTALFSATMPPEIRRTIAAHLSNPRQIAVTPQSSTVAGVEQCYAVVPSRHKIGALARVLATSDAEAALVFVHTKVSAEEVGAALVEREISASVISGDVPQAERERIVERLRAGQLNVLVATDVAARGLDVDRIGLVVNFDMPREAEGYVHRIGRTGRAGRSGVAMSFVTPKERERVRRIEKATQAEIIETPIPTPAEVSAHRIAGLLAQVPARLANGRLQVARQAVDEFLAVASRLDGDNNIDQRLEQATQLATALAALSVGDRGPSQQNDDQMDAELAQLAHRREYERPTREKASRGAADTPNHVNAGRKHGHDRIARYWVGVGHRDRVKPGAIVGAITGEGGLRGQDIGQIEMFATYSTVEIRPELSGKTMHRLSKAQVAGRALRLRPDAGGMKHRRRSEFD